MFKKTSIRGWMQNFLFSIILLCSFFFSSFAASGNQNIPIETCNLTFDSNSCFPSSDSLTLIVGEHVTTLDETFRYCLDTTTAAGFSAIKVILCIDNTGSMCTDNPANDPTDQRIIAARRFIDSLKIKSPNSYVGVIVFGNSVESSYGPIQLSNTQNFSALHAAIEDGACTPTVSRLYKTTATYQGLALDSAFKMMEALNAKVTTEMKQHILMLTDDGWYITTDKMPAELLATHTPLFAGNTLPKVHTILLSASGTVDSLGTLGLENLQFMSDTTNGLYIDDGTPENITAKLLEILESMTPRKDKLTDVTITNLMTNETHTMTLDSITGSVNDFLVSGSSWTLADGTNKFEIIKTYLMKDSTTSVLIDTITVKRSSTVLIDTISDESKLVCVTDMPNITVVASPDSVNVKDSVRVTAQIDPSYTLPFAISNVVVRAYTASGESDNSLAALFHLDSNTNNAVAGITATGSPSWDANGAFGACASNGSITVPYTIPGGDFAVDFWVNRSSGSSATILSCDKFSIASTNDGTLELNVGNITMKSSRSIFYDVWTNVALSRSGGKLAVFINGIKTTSDTASSISGSVNCTFNASNGFKIDEIRLSSVSRRKSSGTIQLFTIPAANGITWKVGNSRTVSDSVSIASTDWNGNLLDLSLRRNSTTEAVANVMKYDAENAWSVNSNTFKIASSLPTPIPVTVSLYDENGNGFIDRMTINLPDSCSDSSQLKATLPSLESFLDAITLETYSGSAVLHPATMQIVNSREISVSMQENTGTVYETGWISAFLSFKSVPMVKSGAILDLDKIIDKAGPVIVSAAFTAGNESESNRIDTIHVSFSEPLTWLKLGSTSPADAFIYYHLTNVDAAAFASLDGSNVLVSDDGLGATIIISNDYFVKPGQDSLQLKCNANFVVDKNGNAANLASRIAPITGDLAIRYSYASITLFDSNGNGYLDRMEVVLQDTATFASDVSDVIAFSSLTLETYFGEATLHQQSAVRENDRTVIVALNENSDGRFETGWISSNISFKVDALTSGGRALRVSTVIDKAGPVISRASYRISGNPEAAVGAHDPDFVEIEFSEPLEWKQNSVTTPSDVYNYYQSGNLFADAFKDIQSDAVTLGSDERSASIEMTNYFYVLPMYDSIQLKQMIDHVTDSHGNAASETSRKTVIEGTARSFITIAPNVNPYVPGEEINSKLNSFYANVIQRYNNRTGVLVTILSTSPLVGNSNGTYGTVDIFDALGNIVKKNLPIVKAASDKDYGIVWDAKNMNNRTVSGGSYLAIVYMKDITNTSYTKRVKIGVKGR